MPSDPSCSALIWSSVIFDSDEINDLATFEDPEVLSAGIYKVFVNGKLAFEKGKQVKELNGYFV